MVLRVVQWTTGNVGQCAVRALVERPQFELVGVFAHSADKVGRDAGELCRIDPIGVTATDDIDALLALEPDCVLYTPLFPDYDHVCRILEAGINVVSTSAFINGHALGADLQTKLDAAARTGGVSLLGTGINPGLANVFGLIATQVCRRVDFISVLESVDATHYASPETWLQTGFCRPLGDPESAKLARANMLVFQDAVAMMADALGAELDDIRFDVEFAGATDTVDLGWMTIDKGHVCGLKGSWVGVAGGKDLISLDVIWKLGYSMEPDWPIEHGYVVSIKGEPDVEARLLPKGSPNWTSITDYTFTTAMPAVNAIPFVVAAPPGIVSSTDLPVVAGQWGGAWK